MHLALLQLAGVLSGNNTILYEEKNKYECTFGYKYNTVKLFKGDRQIYIQMKAYVFPFQDNISILFGMASYLKDPPCARSTPSTCRCSQWKQCNTV